MNKGNWLLLLAAMIWGMSLVAQQGGMEHMGPWSFTAIRCTLGGLSMIPLVAFLDKNKKKTETAFDWKKDTVKTIKPAALCAVFLCTCIMCQQYGLLYTGVGKGAFITALYIFITPVLCLILGQKVEKKIWIAVIFALAGLYMITMSSGFDAINKGDIIMLGAALSYSIFIVVVDRVDESIDTVKMACMQFLMLGIFCFIPAFILEAGDITWANIMLSITPILYAGIISCAGGYTLQMLGQKTADASKASLILSSETVFSLLAGFLILHEILKPKEYIGCIIMTIAIIISVLPGKRNKE